MQLSLTNQLMHTPRRPQPKLIRRLGCYRKTLGFGSCAPRLLEAEDRYSDALEAVEQALLFHPLQGWLGQIVWESC